MVLLKGGVFLLMMFMFHRHDNGGGGVVVVDAFIPNTRRSSTTRTSSSSLIVKQQHPPPALFPSSSSLSTTITVPFSSSTRRQPSAKSSSSSSSSTALTLFPPLSSISSSVVGGTTTSLLQRSKVVLPIFAFTTLFLLLVVKNFKRIMWPGYSNLDNALANTHPLPPGIKGCPLFGNQILISNRRLGSGSFWTKASQKLGNVKIFRFFFMGTRGFVISGGLTLKKIMNTEYQSKGLYVKVGEGNYLGPTMLWEQNQSKHSYLRKLVGQALTPYAVKKAIPNLVEASKHQIQQRLLRLMEEGRGGGGEVITIAEEICTDFTLEVAWKQILGLRLKTTSEEIEFASKVNDWITGIVDPRISLNMGVSKTRGYQAKLYLVEKIEDRINELQTNGPDSSTLSGMVYAIDDDDDDDSTNRKLSKEDIIGNSLLLILAGSETSASTLSNCFLCLGKNYHCWKKLQKEQDDIIAKYGTDEASWNKVVSDKECPYLDSCIREALRLAPIATGAPRKNRSTLTIDGYQIPAESLINWNIRLTHNLDPTTYKDDMSHMDLTKEGGGYNPERWLNESTRPAQDFIPFGAGPHYCLGVNLAYAEMKIFLATAARTFDFQLAGSATKDPIEYKRLSIMPKERNGVPFIARPRTNAKKMKPTTSTEV